MSMFAPKKKEEIVVSQPVAVQAKDTKQLERLFNELGSLRWVAPQGERGWNECVEAVRRRIIEMVRE